MVDILALIHDNIRVVILCVDEKVNALWEINDMIKKNAFYAQSGGVTAVINASACGVIETARTHKDKIGKIYAGRNGIIGALTEDLIDTSKDSVRAIAALRHTPSGAFGSCRYKLKGLDDNRAEYERLIEVFAAHNIGYFFYNGGGDSADTCLKVSQISKALGYPIQAIHIPKTVDNDLPITDNCPGFGSVAKYVAVSIREAAFDVASMAKTSTKIFVMEVMGRHAGWIAAAGGLAAENTGDAPQMIQNKHGYKYHWAVADYLQRAARHIASKTDVEQAYAVGKAAVEMALKGKNAVMPAIKRISNTPYKWKISEARLARVANVEKMMPRNYISKDGFHITPRCRRYLYPLIQGEDYPPFKNGLPQYVTLKNVAVTKKLDKTFKVK